jgi:hypothetical protein
VYGVATLELIVRGVPIAIERESILTELQVHRNGPNIQPGEDAWGFGQIIAVILILGNLIDIVVAIRKRYGEKTPPDHEA